MLNYEDLLNLREFVLQSRTLGYEDSILMEFDLSDESWKDTLSRLEREVYAKEPQGGKK